MFSLRLATVALGVLATLSVAPRSSLAQQPSNGDDCNQAMRDPIGFVSAGVPQQPHISPDGCWIFVGSQNGPAVLRRRGGVIEQHRLLNLQGQVTGLTRDGKILVIATDEAIFIDVEKVLSGDKDIVLGRDSDRHFSPRHGMGGITKDDYLFLVQNGLNWVSVIDLNAVRAGAPGDAVIGGFATGWNAQLAFSPDERYLYVASGQSGGGGQVPPPPCTLTGDPLEEREGTILVVDVQRAKSDPLSAVIGGVRAACGGGVATSPDGAFLYLSERLGDSLLVFDAKAVASGGAPALVARVPVIGTTPGAAVPPEPPAVASAQRDNYSGLTDVAVIDAGKRVVVKSLHHLTVIDAERVQNGADAIVGTISVSAGSGRFHWRVVPTPDRKTLLVEVGSGLAIIDVDRLPLEPVKRPH